jgi:hypothetical protein
MGLKSVSHLISAVPTFFLFSRSKTGFLNLGHDRWFWVLTDSLFYRLLAVKVRFVWQSPFLATPRSDIFEQGFREPLLVVDLMFLFQEMGVSPTSETTVRIAPK